MSIYKKLFEAKKEIGKITKDSKNPFFKSNYLSLNGLIEAVENVLEQHKLLLIQPIKDNKVCSVIIDVEDTESFVSSGIELTNITDPQKRGSEITYYRRYTLQSLLGLQAEDDDANNASNKTQQKPQETEKAWLNKFTDKSEKEVTRNWNRAIATLKEGKDITYLRNHFKISKAIETLLENEVNIPA